MIGVVVSLSAFIICTICVSTGVTNSLDIRFSEFVIAHRSDFMTKIMKFFTGLGNGYLAGTLIGLMYLLTDIYTVAIPVSTAAGIAILSAKLLKRIIKRDRPEGNRLVEETDYSFPSYHTVGIVGLLLPTMIYLNGAYPEYAVVVSVICLVVMFNVSFSRIYLGVHYLMDIVGGVAWASFMTLLVIVIM